VGLVDYGVSGVSPLHNGCSPEPNDKVALVVVVLQDGERRSADAIQELVDSPLNCDGRHDRDKDLEQSCRPFIGFQRLAVMGIPVTFDKSAGIGLRVGIQGPYILPS
jgi:hypothetical protein